jgi:hypothetical protein
MFEFVPPDLARMRDEGNARLVTRRLPSTIAEVLERGRDAMKAEDEDEEYRKDPLAYVRAHRPRRTLLQRLLYGREAR